MEKKRSDELMSEYPELVDKLTLYLGAGVTVRGAFARIVKSGRKIVPVRIRAGVF